LVFFNSPCFGAPAAVPHSRKLTADQADTLQPEAHRRGDESSRASTLQREAIEISDLAIEIAEAFRAPSTYPPAQGSPRTSPESNQSHTSPDISPEP
jgi:hypothetical protein